jgi:hypothetical protein
VPLPLSYLVGLALGAALAWVAKSELCSTQTPIGATRPFAVVSAFALFVWSPVVGYFVAFHGDWSYLYLVSCRRVPSAIDLTLVLLSGAAIVGGFWLASWSLRKRRIGPVALLSALPTVGVVSLITVFSRRLVVSATYAQFRGDFGVEPIAASLLGRGVLFMGIVLVVAVAWTARWLARMSSDEPS